MSSGLQKPEAELCFLGLLVLELGRLNPRILSRYKEGRGCGFHKPTVGSLARGMLKAKGQSCTRMLSFVCVPTPVLFSLPPAVISPHMSQLLICPCGHGRRAIYFPCSLSKTNKNKQRTLSMEEPRTGWHNLTSGCMLWFVLDLRDGLTRAE